MGAGSPREIWARERRRGLPLVPSHASLSVQTHGGARLLPAEAEQGPGFLHRRGRAPSGSGDLRILESGCSSGRRLIGEGRVPAWDRSRANEDGPNGADLSLRSPPEPLRVARQWLAGAPGSPASPRTAGPHEPHPETYFPTRMPRKAHTASSVSRHTMTLLLPWRRDFDRPGRAGHLNGKTVHRGDERDRQNLLTASRRASHS